MGNGVTEECTKECGCLREIFRQVKHANINSTNIRDEHSEVWGSGGNWLGMEAPDPRGSV